MLVQHMDVDVETMKQKLTQLGESAKWTLFPEDAITSSGTLEGHAVIAQKWAGKTREVQMVAALDMADRVRRYGGSAYLHGTDVRIKADSNGAATEILKKVRADSESTTSVQGYIAWAQLERMGTRSGNVWNREAAPNVEPINPDITQLVVPDGEEVVVMRAQNRLTEQMAVGFAQQAGARFIQLQGRRMAICVAAPGTWKRMVQNPGEDMLLFSTVRELKDAEEDDDAEDEDEDDVGDDDDNC